MRNLKWGVAALGLMLAPAANAQLYGGISVGQTWFDPDESAWRAPGTSTTFDDNDTAWKVFIGWNFSRYFGIEGQYADLGRYKATITSAAPPDSGTAEVKVTSWAGYLVGRLPVNDKVSFFGKAGFASNESNMTFRSSGAAFLAGDSGKDSRSSFAYGIGATFVVAPRVGIRAEYENFGKSGKSNNGFTSPNRTGESEPTLFSVGVQFTLQ